VLWLACFCNTGSGLRKPHLSQLASTLSWTAFGQCRRKVRIPGLGCSTFSSVPRQL
jgi:hypothetical protein